MRKMRQLVLRRGARKPELVEATAPSPAPGEALLRSRLVGLDGTDSELLTGDHGAFPEGEDHLVMGHECLAEVVTAPQGSGLRAGDLVVPLVRHPCGICPLCRAGKVDLCTSGRYREHGIAKLHGFLRDEWTDDPATLVRVPPGAGDEAVLTEPLSIALKALEQAKSVQRRVPWFEGFAGQRVLLAGAGSLGTLAAFLLAEEGARVWAFDRSPHESTGARLLGRLGATHVRAQETELADLAREVDGFDLVVESTGVASVAFEAARALDENGCAVLLGVPGSDADEIDAAALMRDLVLGNRAVVGSVNSNRRHFELSLEALQRLKKRWPEELRDVITHRYAPDDAVAAVTEDPEDAVKKVVDWSL